jgi:GAF domain-containing protein
VPGLLPVRPARHRRRPDRRSGRWQRFAPTARHAGFAAVQALPMRLRGQVIGALNLFRATPGAFDPADVRVGQALADVATISLLHERGMRHSDT